jgi:hypothetical protein
METKRKTGIRVDYDTSLGVMTWVDIEGKVPSVVVSVTTLSDEIHDKALWHGIDQKVTDAGAMGMDYWDGKDKAKRSATTAERLNRMRRVADNLANGQWTVRTATDPLAGKTTEELNALIAKAQAQLAKIGVSL